MSDARRTQDDEPLTQLDVAIDTKHLDSLVEGEVSTSPGIEALKNGDAADEEPQTMEPPRKMGVPRLRANTIMGVAPPSSGNSGIPVINPREGEDEQTTLVGKLLAEAHAEVRDRLKERAVEKEADLYQDETATTVGDAEKLIATARAAAKVRDPDEVDEPTESRLRDGMMEDTTSKRDAINIDEALARAAELRAEAEARKKRQLKKQTMHGLGNGPLKLPARPKLPDDDIPTAETDADITKSGVDTEAPSPADAEPETLSVAGGMPIPMRAIGTEPETVPVQLPPSSRERHVTSPVHGSALLTGNSGNVGNAATMLSHQAAVPLPPPPPMTQGPPMHAPPYTQPMPHAPTVRMDDQGGLDPLRATLNAPPGNGMMPHPPSSPHQLSATPPGGVPHYHSTPMPVHAPMGMPHSGPPAFARTAVQTGSGPAVLPDAPAKKGGRGGLIAFLLLLVVAGGAGYWKRAMLRDTWHRYRRPPPVATAAAEPAPSTTAAATSAAPITPPPVATEAPTASVAPSASVAPTASASASASASAKPTGKKPPPWKPPPWKPKSAPKPVPKPAPDNGGGYGF